MSNTERQPTDDGSPHPAQVDTVSPAAAQEVDAPRGFAAQQRLDRLSEVLRARARAHDSIDSSSTDTAVRSCRRHHGGAEPDSDSDLNNNDDTAQGLHRVLAQVQSENRQLRQQIAAAHDREVQIVALSIKSQEDFATALKQVENLKLRVRSELVHPVSEESLRAVVAKPETSRDLVDEIRLAVFGQLGALSRARDSAERRVAELETALRESETTRKRAEEELAALEGEKLRELGVLKAQLDLQTQRATLAEEAARSATLTIDANQAKAARCDRAELERARFEQQLAHAKDDAATFEAKYRHAAAELVGVKEELQRAQVLLHSAQSEITFLSREREALASRSQEAESRISRLEAALADAQQHRVDAAHAAATEKEALRSSMERHLASELDRYRTQFLEDIERVRESSRQAAEREILNLREARERDAADALRFKTESDEAKAALDASKTASAAKVEQLQIQLYELRMQLSSKSSDVVRLDLHLREAESAKERHQMDAECLQRKLDILKEEFYDLKSSYRDEVSQLTAKLAAQEEQLALMKDMEAEAEVYLAHAARSDNMDASGLVADIPASRRITNAISVTRKALALENQVELLKHDKGVMEARLLKLKAELDMAKEALRGGNSPYALMEEAIDRKDREIERRVATEKTLRSEVAVLEEKLRVALQDVRVLQSHRSELIRIRAYLEELQQKNQLAMGSTATLMHAAAPAAADNASPPAANTRVQAPLVRPHTGTYGISYLGEAIEI